jgi:hypothetical protein
LPTAEAVSDNTFASVGIRVVAASPAELGKAVVVPLAEQPRRRLTLPFCHFFPVRDPREGAIHIDCTYTCVRVRAVLQVNRYEATLHKVGLSG